MLMNFKKLFLLFKNNSDDKGTGNVKKILQLPYLMVHPNSLLESFCMAIVWDTKETCHFCANEIELYELHEKGKDKSFLGTCWALYKGGKYYANIAGSDAIVSFKKDDFILKKTKQLWLPIREDQKGTYVLICKFKHKSAEIIPLSFNKVILKEMCSQEVIELFDKDTPFNKAIEICMAKSS